MTKKQLIEAIKVREAELEVLKRQLEDMMCDDVVCYEELLALELEEIENVVEKYSMSQIRKVYEQVNIEMAACDRNDAIYDLIEIFRERRGELC